MGKTSDLGFTTPERKVPGSVWKGGDGFRSKVNYKKKETEGKFTKHSKERLGEVVRLPSDGERWGLHKQQLNT